MVSRSVDDVLQRVPSDHVGIVDENAPEIDSDEEAEIQDPMQREQ